ncbi:MaoC domain protein dehydratase [Segniliparus rotundus DSM 44985]|uniref:MaoC domain protein dehydratase n=1 Tax=Segniliparus rotundus (strain ATCC BAA-972 / CDC 1076 / CIP 108378 / DSM 44985 / JCM 13578) TaxID=640132 RepID=D6ZBM5_SEGRD|nr:MaoC domain protein dehydratase [Segniliparus rotundus DSM 44985]
MTTQESALGQAGSGADEIAHLSLAERLANGEPYAIAFGGQGGSWLDPLAELVRGAELEGHANCLVAEAAELVSPVADELSVARPHGFEPMEWMHWEQAPSESVLLPPAVSSPGLFFGQVLALRALTALGLDWRGKPPVGFAGHSLGLIAVEAAQHGGEHDAQLLALAQLIGASASLVARRNGLIGSEQAPALVSVRNVDPEFLRALLAEFHEAHNNPGDPVLALRNGRRSVTISGNPQRLVAFEAYATRISEKQVQERKKKLRGGAVFEPGFEPVRSLVGFHHPRLAPAVDLVAGWAERCGLDVGLARSFAQQILVDPVDWVERVQELVGAGAKWILDAGPGDMLTRFTKPVVRGHGVGVVPAATRDGHRALFTRGEAPQAPRPWSDFAPELVRLPSGKLAAQTAFTKFTGRSPILLAGMTPTTVDPKIVAAAANAGHWAELAGGGQVTEEIFAEHVAGLQALLEPGRAVQFNSLFLDPYLWKLQVSGKRIVPKARLAGAPFDGLVVTAGVPELPEALQLIEDLHDLGFSSISFKPGTVEQIKAVIRIAREAGPARTVIAHIEGGRAGGHHSWEDLDELLLSTYHELRAQQNLVICVGGGIGTADRAADYLTGEWSAQLGYPNMPVDGVLVGTAAMATLEATTSPDVKRLLVETGGSQDWIPAGGQSGGMASGRSQLGADIHEIDNSASRCGRLLDEVAGDEESVARRRDEIIEALGKTAKPYFGDVAAMTYREWLDRYVELSAPARQSAPGEASSSSSARGDWLDVTWQERFLAMARRAEARLSPVDEGEIETMFPDLDSVLDAGAALDRLAEAFPDLAHTVLHPGDVSFFTTLCKQIGKPVGFVPVIDKDVRRWWRSDSLWQAHDARYSADQVCVIPGPVAIAGITRQDEPVGELLDRFEQAAVQRLAASGAQARDVPARRGTAFDGPLGVFLATPDVLWAQRLTVNPVRRLGDLQAWRQVEPHLVEHHATGATVVLTDDNRVTLSIPVNDTWLALRFTLPESVADGGVPVLESSQAEGAMTGLLHILAGGELPKVADGVARARASWTPDLPADHAGVTAAALPKPLVPTTVPHLGKVVPDVLVGLSWPVVFAVLGSAKSGSGAGVIEGLLDLVHLDHAVRLCGEVPSWETTFAVEARLVGVADTGLGRVVEIAVDIADEASGRPVAQFVERFAIRGRVGEAELQDPLRAGGAVSQDAVDTTRAKRREAVIAAPADLRAFAQVSGDHNPIHTSLVAAKLAGLPMPIVHGMWLSAAAQQVVAAADLREGQPAPRRIVGWTARFLGMVYPESQVHVRVDRVGVDGGGELVEVACRVDGELVMSASARLAPPKTVYAFPGQGVQAKGMGLAARGRSKAARTVWDRADKFTKEELGFSILGVVRDNPASIVVNGVRHEHPDGVLHLTQFTQVAMATVAMAQLEELKESGAYVDDAILCGHSVGEYNALAAVAGVLPLEGVLAVVYRRGMTMNDFLPRDADGGSNYRMAAIRPVHLGLGDDDVFDWVERLSRQSGEFLQIVNYNLRETQYAIAGTVAGVAFLEKECKRRQDEVGGKASFIRVPGVDVPFHSTLLRPGVPAFREVLLQIIPEDGDPSLVVGKYVPNLVARVFSLEKEFVESILEVVPSEPIQEILHDWTIWSSQPGKLTSRLVVELLAWQFASPVRWIETQDLLFSPALSGGLQVERFVEIGVGNAPTLANMARNTLRLDLFAGTRVEPLNIERDWALATSVDEPVEDEEPEAELQAPAAEAASPPQPAAAAASAPSPAASGPRPDDIAFTAADASVALIALSTKLRPDQLLPADSIESLCEGASSRRNQLLLDLGAELNLGAIDGAGEADLPSLKTTVNKLARTYKPYGPVLSDAVNDQIRKVLGPTGKRSSHVLERVKEVWELGPGWGQHVLVAIALGTRDGASVRDGQLGVFDLPANAGAADALVDAAVAAVGAAHGVPVALPAKGTAGGGTVDASVLAELTEHITGPDGVLAAAAKLVLSRLGHAEEQAPVAADVDSELAELVAAELGSDWPRVVAPVFDSRKAVVFDDRWASAREDLARVWATGEALPADRFAGAGEAVSRQAAWWSGKARAAEKTELAQVFQAYAARADEDAKGEWSRDVAVVTGAGKGSIATAVLGKLLAGGATVIATTSSLSEERLAFYRTVYQRNARVGAVLWVVPANMASYQDVDAFVDWISTEQTRNLGGIKDLVKPALNPTLLFPFAAPRVAGDLADAGPRAELEMKVLLWATQRLIGSVAAKTGAFDLGSRLHVVLPGSPNRGLFGGDGAYGESKAALDALVARWQSEKTWTQRVTLAHAIIGWVRGTGLMGGNDAVVETVERHGVRTYSADEMADELLELCTLEARALAGDQPLTKDLTGGLAGVRLDMAALAEEVQKAAAAKEPQADGPQTIQALPSPARLPAAADFDWPSISADPKDLVVIVGAGEVGPYGSSRTRFEVEVTGELSAAGVLELAWVTGLVAWQRDPQPGWYDNQTGELVPEEEIAEKYREHVLAHSGIRLFTNTTLVEGDSETRPLHAEVFLTQDLTFVVTSEAEAKAFADSDPEHTVIAPVPGSSDWTVTRKEGTQIRVPRKVKMTRTAGAQVPDGFDPTVWGVPKDLVAVADRVALWNLVATVDAFTAAGFSPAELLQTLHPTQVSNVQGVGMGGLTSLLRMYHDFLFKGSLDQNDLLQETLPNVPLAHVVQSYIGSYGPMVHPVGACATAAVSIEEGVDKIALGKTLFAVAGGYDDISIQEVLGFAEMNATADMTALAEQGISPARASRANDRRRAGFVDSQGGGTILLTRGDVALRLGLPVLGVVGFAQSFGDGVHTSIPAPGLGALATGLGGRDSRFAQALAKFGLTADDVAVVSKHDTSTLANDPNEAMLHERLQAAIGRSDGAPLFVVSQKSLTGHSKGGAAAFQTVGLCQVLASGRIPPNRSLDCVDGVMDEHEHLVWLKEPLAFDESFPLKAGVVTSLGFGHVSGMVLVVHPKAFEAALSPEERAAYAQKAAQRRVCGQRRLQEVMHGGDPAYSRPSDRRFAGEDHKAEEAAEAELLLDPAHRLASSGHYTALDRPLRADGK